MVVLLTNACSRFENSAKFYFSSLLQYVFSLLRYILESRYPYPPEVSQDTLILQSHTRTRLYPMSVASTIKDQAQFHTHTEKNKILTIFRKHEKYFSSEMHFYWVRHCTYGKQGHIWPARAAVLLAFFSTLMFLTGQKFHSPGVPGLNQSLFREEKWKQAALMIWVPLVFEGTSDSCHLLFIYMQTGSNLSHASTYLHLAPVVEVCLSWWDLELVS